MGTTAVRAAASPHPRPPAGPPPPFALIAAAKLREAVGAPEGEVVTQVAQIIRNVLIDDLKVLNSETAIPFDRVQKCPVAFAKQIGNVAARILSMSASFEPKVLREQVLRVHQALFVAAQGVAYVEAAVEASKAAPAVGSGKALSRRLDLFDRAWLHWGERPGEPVFDLPQQHVRALDSSVRDALTKLVEPNLNGANELGNRLRHVKTMIKLAELEAHTSSLAYRYFSHGGDSVQARTSSAEELARRLGARSFAPATEVFLRDLDSQVAPVCKDYLREPRPKNAAAAIAAAASVRAKLSEAADKVQRAFATRMTSPWPRSDTGSRDVMAAS